MIALPFSSSRRDILEPSRRAARLLLLALLSGGLVAHPWAIRPARAQTPSTEGRTEAKPAEPRSVKTLIDEAFQHYARGEYDAAIEDFEAAYAREPKPEYVFNAARSYEKALRVQEAIAAYERFVNLPGTTAELRSRAFESLGALRREANARDRAVQSTEPPRSPEQPPRVVSGVQTSAPPPQGPDNTLPWGLVAGGGGLIAVGAVFGGIAAVRASELSEARGVEPVTRQQELADAVERNALVADIMFGVGGAAALTGIILVLVNETRGPVAVAPSTAGGSTGLVLNAQF